MLSAPTERGLGARHLFQIAATHSRLHIQLAETLQVALTAVWSAGFNGLAPVSRYIDCV